MQRIAQRLSSLIALLPASIGQKNTAGSLSVTLSSDHGALPAGTNAIGKLAANSGVDIGDVDITSVIPGTAATSLGKAEDAAHSSGDTGVMALGVRKDTAAALAGTDGDYQPLITDANGRLHVQTEGNASGSLLASAARTATTTGSTQANLSAQALLLMLDVTSAPAWTSRTSAADNGWFAIAWSPALGLFAAVAYTGTGNRVMTSPDGITWTSRTSAADNNWHGIAWSPALGLFAAVANSGTGNRVMTSPDGITWTSRTSAADNNWHAIAWSPALGLFAAVAYSGTGNRVMTSPDGITWTSRTSAADNGWHGIAWSPELGLFAAVANSGTGNRVMTSPDGITWTSRTSAADNNWLAIAWSPALGLFAAVAYSGTGNRVMTSPDGITWTSRTSAADNDWLAIAWSPALGLFAAVASSGTGNRVMTSPDGITWTSRTSAADNGWRGIAWSPALGLFAAVAYSGTGNRVMTWTPGGGLRPTIEYLDPVSGAALRLPLPPPVVTTGPVGYAFSDAPNSAVLSPVVNVYVPGPLARSWRPVVVHGDATAYTYSLGYTAR